MNIKEFLKRYLDKDPTRAERAEIMRLYNEGKLDDKTLHEAMDEILRERSDVDVNAHRTREIFAAILTDSGRGKVVPLYQRRYWAWAAAVATILILAGVWWQFPAASVDQYATVSRSKDSFFSAAPGQSEYLQLPDGSTVILNEKSELFYRASYGEKDREIILTGEAYFDVKHDPERPFIVRSASVSTRVLGTAFNVKAYAGQKNVVVTVARGKVRVFDQDRELGDITPDQQISVNTSSHEFEKSDTKAEQAVAWTSRLLILDHITMEEAAAIIGKRYNTTIEFAGEHLKRCPVMATFLSDEPLDHVLTVMSAISGMTYVIREDGSVVLDGKGCR